MKEVKIGIIRETKDPPDKRVPLSPEQCRELLDTHAGLQILVQPSELRCYADREYEAAGIPLSEDLGDCHILMGVKEVKTAALIPGKTYLFFSHTAKKQPYNRDLLRTLVEKGIQLVDYEYLTTPEQVRVVAFGRWAGVVGAYNGLRARGLRSGTFSLPPATELKDLEEMLQEIGNLDLGSIRIALTGGGRVAGGALEVLQGAGVREVTPEDYLAKEYQQAVFSRLDPWHYTRHREGREFDFTHFMAHPEEFENHFLPYARRTDLFIACHFWDPASPVMLTRESLSAGDIPIRIIADISCDIDGPIASTIRASTIAEPFYGYDPLAGKETEAFDSASITVMAVDNLPGELPRDASRDFGSALAQHVIPELLGEVDTGMLERASITAGGKLTPAYKYLQDYLEGKE